MVPKKYLSLNISEINIIWFHIYIFYLYKNIVFKISKSLDIKKIYLKIKYYFSKYKYYKS